MRQIKKAFVLAVALAARTAQVSAQSTNSAPSAVSEISFPSMTGAWTVAVGANLNGQPAFEGSKTSALSVAPIFSIGRTGGSSERFISPRDSASVALVDYEGFSAGPAAKLKSSRKAGSHPELSGLDDVGRTLELGGFVQYFPIDWFRLRSEIRRGFGGHDGVVADLSADVIVPVWKRLIVSGGPRFTVESDRATAAYFSIDPAQSLVSGLPTFDAKGGAHSVGAGTQLRYQFTPQWETHTYVEYDRLLGDAASSPLVAQRGSPNQVSFGLGASYSFDFRIP
jgi:outer membrane protein